MNSPINQVLFGSLYLTARLLNTLSIVSVMGTLLTGFLNYFLRNFINDRIYNISKAYLPQQTQIQIFKSKFKLQQKDRDYIAAKSLENHQRPRISINNRKGCSRISKK
jgi:hypothetical protein